MDGLLLENKKTWRELFKVFSCSPSAVLRRGEIGDPGMANTLRVHTWGAQVWVGFVVSRDP